MPSDMDKAHAICVPCAQVPPSGLAVHRRALVLYLRAADKHHLSALDSLPRAEPAGLRAQAPPSQWTLPSLHCQAGASVLCLVPRLLRPWRLRAGQRCGRGEVWGGLVQKAEP